MQSKGKNAIMFYLSAFIAVLGAVGYQYFVKLVPPTINPMISVMGCYLAVLGMGVILLVIFPAQGGLLANIRQLNWIQLALAVTVVMIELGFLLMYRYGWNLSTGNLITGVFVNIMLVGLGLALLGERVSPVNALGIVLSIVGVALISYRS
jgi:drug/metabolite transporter (DMT)-like permease